MLIQEDRFLIPFSAASPRQGQGDPPSPTPHPVKAQIDFNGGYKVVIRHLVKAHIGFSFDWW